jgi:flagellar M-ring protein FliF
MPQQRLTVALAGALAVAGVIGLVFWSGRPSFSVLYSDLSQQDAGAIVEYLKTKRTPYRISAGGSAVEVDQAQVYPLRLSLAQEGIPKSSGGVGFEIFDKTGLPGSEFSNQVSYQRALQGELERTIGSLEKVRSARVHIVLPKRDLYNGEQKASASIVVDTKGGQALSPREVEGIVRLTASAVQDLDPAAVTLVDAEGRILNGAGAGGGGALTREQMEARQEYEAALQRQLQTMLDRSLGENTSVVQVKAELDFSQQHLKTQSVAPSAAEGSLIEEKVSEEQYAGGGGAGAAAAGVSSNIQAGLGAGTQGGAGTYKSRQSQRQYEYTREERELVSAPGELKRLTVAVVVDEELPASAADQVNALVKAAAGIKDQRGDQVVVERMSLAAKTQAAETAKQADKEQAAQRRGQLLARLLQYGVLLALGFVVGGAMLTAARQVRGAAGRSEETDAGPLQMHADATPETGVHAAVLPDAGIAMASPPIAQNLEQLARESPAAFAQQLRQMLGEEER